MGMTQRLVSESKNDSEDLRVLILTSRSEKNEDNLYRTADRIKEECIKRNIQQYVLFTDGHISRDNDRYSVYNYDDKKGFGIDPKNTVAISRGSVMSRDSSKDLISQLERAGIFCVNTRDSIEICGDKYRTMLRMADSGIPTPQTALIQNIDTLPLALKQMDGKFPYVVKTLRGSKGVGVFLAESEGSLKAILQLIWKIDESEELIIQSFIKASYDVRAHVLGDNVIAAMKRHIVKNDFRSNYSQGGKVEDYKMSEEEKELCIAASKVIGVSWAGVDFITDEDGNKYILEVNSSPGTEGIEKATHDNIVSDVLDWISDKKNWSRTCKEIGYKEVVKIEGEKFVAKFDTGNGNLVVLHADKIKADGKKISWVCHGKKFSGKDLGKLPVVQGGLRSGVENRIRTEVDIEFDGILHKNVECTLDDRGGRTPILINRDFMKKASVMVNPARTYVITERLKD